MQKNLKRRQFFILCIDILLMYVSLVLALIIRKGSLPSLASLQEHIAHFTIIFFWWVIVFYTLGFYRLDRAFDSLNYAKLLTVGLVIAGLSSALYFYIIPTAYIAPKTVLLLLVLIYGVLLWAWRYTYENIWFKKGRYCVGVGFVGFTEEVQHIIKELNRHTLIGYDARFIFDENIAAEGQLLGLPFVHDHAAVRAIVKETDADLIVLSQQYSLPPDIIRELYGLLDMRVRFMRLPDFYEMIFRRVPIDAINEAWFLENIDLKSAMPYEIIKGIGDRILAFLSLIIVLPFWPLIALVIKLESAGPVFFRQERVGRFGKPFTMIKFRTMRVEGNDHSPTAEGDGRITKFGSFLRASRIDELPQFVNILQGEMSFIGPRPERPELAQELAASIPYYQQRHLMKPGVTGWDQVCGEYHSPSIEDTQKKLQYDLYYLKNMSFSLDVSIFFKTIMTVFQRKGR